MFIFCKWKTTIFQGLTVQQTIEVNEYGMHV